MPRITYDSTDDAMFIEILKGRYEACEELAENIILDMDREDRVLW